MSVTRSVGARLTILVAVLMALGASAALADRAYHSERLALEAAGLEGHPELRSGHVVNIHPDGPNNYAHERYTVNGAAVDTPYQVVIEVHGDINCDSPDPFELPTAILQTDGRGNGHAGITLTPEDVEGFRPATLYIRWSLRVGDVLGAEAYGTRCTEVVLD